MKTTSKIIALGLENRDGAVSIVMDTSGRAYLVVGADTLHNQEEFAGMGSTNHVSISGDAFRELAKIATTAELRKRWERFQNPKTAAEYRIGFTVADMRKIDDPEARAMVALADSVAESEKTNREILDMMGDRHWSMATP